MLNTLSSDTCQWFVNCISDIDYKTQKTVQYLKIAKHVYNYDAVVHQKCQNILVTHSCVKGYWYWINVLS